MLDAKVTCLVTIHGIGFEQPPVGSIPGYADELHRKLSRRLGPDLLSDDPGRAQARTGPGDAGPIYVQSDYPSGSNDQEQGLSRLGRWNPQRTAIDTTGAPLLDAAHRDRPCLAHVALVYSNLEDNTHHHLGSALEASVRAVLVAGRYLSFLTLPRWLYRVVRGMLPGKNKIHIQTSSLRVRRDFRKGQRPGVQSQTPVGGKPPPYPSAGLLPTVLALEGDVCAYVCRNDLRTRVRGFVWEALLRLCSRDDVAGVVINAHSQGTVLAFDVVRELPPILATKVRVLYTAGSPLRKYVDLFAWGNEVGILNALPWVNFWDQADPVADPLLPSAGWKAGTDVCGTTAEPTLLQSTGPGGGPSSDVRVVDVPVDNLRNSMGGGLQAHNYWDNEAQVVEHLADSLRKLVAPKVRATAQPRASRVFRETDPGRRPRPRARA